MNKKTVRTIINVALACLFLGGVYIIVRSSILFPTEYEAPPEQTEAITPVPTPEATSEATFTPEPTPTPRPTFAAPAKIYFTAQEISADIIQVGVDDEDNSMEAPDDAKLGGWLTLSVPPGEPGNSIISGHDKWKGEKGTFSTLKKLEPGDEVVIEHADGGFNYFEVIDVNTYLAEEVPDDVMRLTREGTPKLTLITCLGDYDYTGRSKSRVVATCQAK